MKNGYLKIVLSLLLVFGSTLLHAQNTEEVDHSYKPLMVKLSEDGQKYIRFITWHQIWLQSNDLSDDDALNNITGQIRRSRFLAYSQVSPDF